MNTKVSKVAHLLIIFALVLLGLVAAQSLLIPIVFAILFAFLCRPLCNFLERHKVPRIIANFVPFILLFVFLIAFNYFIGTQFFALIMELGEIKTSPIAKFDHLCDWVEKNLAISVSMTKDISQSLLNRLENIALSNNPLTILPAFGAFIIYAFLILLYRSALKNFLLVQFPKSSRAHVREVFAQIQQVTQQYLLGLLAVVAFLTITASLGLWLVGLPYPIFWGGLSASLTVIPYVGTFIGAILPFLYALTHASSYSLPLSVLGVFFVVQQLEGNVLTPLIIGKSVKVNPLAAILAMFFGTFIWGIAGLVLAIPVIAVLKIVCDNITLLKPIGAMLSSDIYKEPKLFFEEYDKPMYRLYNLLVMKKNKKENNDAK